MSSNLVDQSMIERVRIYITDKRTQIDKNQLLAEVVSISNSKKKKRNQLPFITYVGSVVFQEIAKLIGQF